MFPKKHCTGSMNKSNTDTQSPNSTQTMQQPSVIDNLKDIDSGNVMEACPSQVFSSSDGSSPDSGASLPADQMPSETTAPSNSQTDSCFDFGYSSFSGVQSTNTIPQCSSSISVDKTSRESIEDWDNIDYDNIYLKREDEVERLLQQFERFFSARYEMEMTQFQESVRQILKEQQNHIRQIVRIGTRDQQSQNSLEDLIEVDDVAEETDTGASARINGSNAVTPTRICGCKPTKTVETSISSTKSSNQSRLLELMSLSCSVSTMLTKREYRM